MFAEPVNRSGTRADRTANQHSRAAADEAANQHAAGRAAAGFKRVATVVA